MNDSNNRPILIAILIIGIIILIMLISPRVGPRYSYRGSAFTASALPVQVSDRQQTGMFTFVRYIPQKSTSNYSSGTTYTYYTYPTTDYSYEYVDQGVVFPDGCTMTSPVSTTTGLPCS